MYKSELVVAFGHSFGEWIHSISRSFVCRCKLLRSWCVYCGCGVLVNLTTTSGTCRQASNTRHTGMGDDQQQLLASVFNTVYGDVIDRFADEYNWTLQLSEQLGHNRSFVCLFAYHCDRIRNGLCSSGSCHRQVYFSSFGGAS